MDTIENNILPGLIMRGTYCMEENLVAVKN